MASVARAGTLPAAVIEVDRIVDINGNAELAKHRLRIGGELARRKVVLRLDGHPIHVVYNDVLAKTLPGPISVQRKVPRDGVVMLARQRLRVGRTYTGKGRYHPRRGHPLPGHP